MGYSKKNAKGGKNRPNKINLVFDENKRREFLSGFHKRKLQRKKDAKEKFERDLKEERRRIKSEAKESYKKLVVSHKPIPELEHLLSEDYEDENVNVKVVQLSRDEITKKNHWIGDNTAIKEESESEEDEEDEKNDDEQVVPGMELKRRAVKVVKEKKEKVQFDSEKDLKKALKKQATKNVKKSKVFQMKNKLEQRKQRKKSMQAKKMKTKIQGKRDKSKRQQKHKS